MSYVLEVNNLVTKFGTSDGVVHAVNGVSFALNEGETLGVVGESGCGKSVTMLSVMRLLPTPPAEIKSGTAQFLGRDLLKMSSSEIRSVRGAQIGMVFQDPMTSLNPVLTIGRQLTEPLEVHQNLSQRDSRDRAVKLLELVNIPSPRGRLEDYPHQFSGGMRQRVMIAMALACTPQLLIADEPTTALDVTIQAQIIELVKRLREAMGMSIIWITHDLGIVAGLAHRVMVMYAGYIVERSVVADLYTKPLHPYTRGLLGSLPRLDETESRRLVNIEGAPPDLYTEPKSCPFAPRCPFAYERCHAENPPLDEVEPGHEVACWWDATRGKPRYDR